MSMRHPRLSLRPRTAAIGLSAALLLLAGCGESAEQQLTKARGALDQRQWEQAQQQAKSVLQGKPQLAEARLVLARALLGLGDAKGAETEIRRAQEYGATPEAAAPVLAQSLLAQGRPAEVIRQFLETQLAEPAAQADLRTSVANAFAQDGNLEAARQAVQEALAARADHGPARLLAARFKANGGDIDGALADLKALVAQQPKFAQALALEGDLLAAKGQDEAALAQWRAALAEQPDLIAVHGAIITTLSGTQRLDEADKAVAAMVKALPKHPETAFFQAVLAESRGDHAKARELTQSLLRLAPENPRILLLAGQAQLALRESAQAEAHFAKAVQVAPKLAAARLMLAQAQLQANQGARAAATLEPLTSADPPNTEALLLQGRALQQAGNVKAAEAAFARLAQLRPDDPRLRLARALGRLGGDQTTGALDELGQIAQGDKGVEIDLTVVQARLRAGDAAGALRQVDRMAEKLKDSPLPEHVRGRIEAVRKNAAAARTHYAAALKVNPDFLPSVAGLAALDLADGQASQARERLNLLQQRQPKNAAVMLALADVAVGAGQPGEASGWLDKAVKAEPASVLPRQMQIDMLLGLGDTTAALAAARAAVIALPGNPGLLERLGRTELAANQAQAAAATFGKLVAQQPTAVRPLLLQADAQRAAGNDTGAKASLAKAVEIGRDQPDVLQAQAGQALREGQTEAALAAARKLQAKATTAAQGWRLEGEAQAAAGRWDAAAAAFQRALNQLTQGNQGAAAGMVAARTHVALLKSGKTAEADRFAADWQSRHADDLNFTLHLGDAALAGGKPEEAERQYRAVLQRQAQHALALNNLAYLQCKRGDKSGLALAEKAVSASPGNGPLLDTLAMCQAAAGLRDKALDSQRLAVKTAPEVAMLRLSLARMLVEAGAKTEARSELRTLQQLGERLPAPQRDEIQRLLQQTGA
ncbi:XrtA/PEP-CTERM system TPR-repeat protein PrsT [Pseudaquabacterium rugosum]|uniref:XrtA/PEP-CTERM system TPR-repeat protein PrsT n=1 Tax=Pseudaquabacterium rugosum TaxID=2984194 RepID=A0ABU9B9B1_9BURK